MQLLTRNLFASIGYEVNRVTSKMRSMSSSTNCGCGVTRFQSLMRDWRLSKNVKLLQFQFQMLLKRLRCKNGSFLSNCLMARPEQIGALSIIQKHAGKLGGAETVGKLRFVNCYLAAPNLVRSRYSRFIGS